MLPSNEHGFRSSDLFFVLIGMFFVRRYYFVKPLLAPETAAQVLRCCCLLLLGSGEGVKERLHWLKRC